MKKAKDLIIDNMKLVDVVLEVCDARIPISSRNPNIHQMTGDKNSILILNKSDLADEVENERWVSYYNSKNRDALSMNSISGQGIKKLFSHLDTLKKSKKTTRTPFRIMIAGIPNSGKSSLINRLAKKKSAATGNKPGVTKGKQWLTLENSMQLLDTPGLLWPKFEDPKTGMHLAICGSIKDEINDVSELALELIKILEPEYGHLLKKRYKIDDSIDETSDAINSAPLSAMNNIAHKRGCLLPGGRIDYERVGKLILDEFRKGLIGRITLEKTKDL